MRDRTAESHGCHTAYTRLAWWLGCSAASSVSGTSGAVGLVRRAATACALERSVVAGTDAGAAAGAAGGTAHMPAGGGPGLNIASKCSRRRATTSSTSPAAGADPSAASECAANACCGVNPLPRGSSWLLERSGEVGTPQGPAEGAARAGSAAADAAADACSQRVAERAVVPTRRPSCAGRTILRVLRRKLLSQEAACK